MTISAAIVGALGASSRPYNYKGFILSSSPIAYWPFEEESGSVFNDVSGNGLHLAKNSNVEMGGASLINDGLKSAVFNGSAALSVNAGTLIPYGNSARTIEAWFLTTKAAGTNALCFFGYGSRNKLQAFNTRTGKTTDSLSPVEKSFVHWCYSDDLSIIGPTAWNNGVAHHIAVTYNGSRSVKLYFDGTLIGSRTLTGDLATPSNSTFFAGGNQQIASSTDFPMQGRMQHLAIYSRELTASEILDRYTKGTT